MYLSTAPLLAVAIAVATLMTACGGRISEPGGELQEADPADRKFPFKVHLPEAFIAEIVISAPGREERFRFARLGRSSRIEIGGGSAAQLVEIRSDAVYKLIPRLSVFTRTDPSPGTDLGAPSRAEVIARQLFTGVENERYEAAGAENGLEVYISRGPGPQRKVWFDPALGLIVRHELGGGVTYELRGISDNPDPTLFAVPESFRSVKREEFERLLKTI